MRLAVMCALGFCLSEVWVVRAEPDASIGTGGFSLSLEAGPSRGSSVRIRLPPEGSGLGYTIESTGTLADPSSWRPAPATIWPIGPGRWTDPRRSGQGGEFYRAVATPAQAERGKLLTAVRRSALSPEEIRKAFEVLGLRLVVGDGVYLEKLTYETVNPFGLRTMASGLVVRPQNATNALPLVSYQHGTLVLKTDVPSALQGLELLIGLALGTSGYVAAIPDYLGLGDSPGLHPFAHAQSAATAAADFLRCTRTFCASNAVALNGQLFLLGYSEGGHATLALQRELETRYQDEFTVTASAPMAGPYDLSGVTLNDYLSGRSMANPFFFLCVLGAYQSVYHFADSLSDLLAAPFDATLPPLLDGAHDASDLNQAMAGATIQIFKPAFLEALRSDPNHPLRLALRENDVIHWTPTAPIRLYHCSGDQDVSYANSEAALASFRSREAANVELINPFPTAGHLDCAPFSLLAAKIWFDTLVRKP